MGDSTSRWWWDADGQRHDGDPPGDWYPAGGRWFPPPPSPLSQGWTVHIAAPSAALGDRQLPRHAAASSRGPLQAYGRWPRWAQIGLPVTVVFLALGFVGSLTTAEEPTRIDLADASDTTSVDRAPTTTTPAPSTSTTTTVPPTTEPTTTLPPTTAPPPTAAPALPPPPPEPEPAPADGCHPSYTPCVPIAFDVDCEGGSGNGPAYVVGPITVIGLDIYGLDNDGDGVGCE